MKFDYIISDFELGLKNGILFKQFDFFSDALSVFGREESEFIADNFHFAQNISNKIKFKSINNKELKYRALSFLTCI